MSHDSGIPSPIADQFFPAVGRAVDLVHELVERVEDSVVGRVDENALHVTDWARVPSLPEAALPHSPDNPVVLRASDDHVRVTCGVGEVVELDVGQPLAAERPRVGLRAIRRSVQAAIATGVDDLGVLGMEGEGVMVSVWTLGA
jgi:hypothetical protein